MAAAPAYVRDHWTIKFNRALDEYEFEAELDMILATEDPLDPHVGGPFGEYTAEGKRIPTENK